MPARLSAAESISSQQLLFQIFYFTPRLADVTLLSVIFKETFEFSPNLELTLNSRYYIQYDSGLSGLYLTVIAYLCNLYAGL